MARRKAALSEEPEPIQIRFPVDIAERLRIAIVHERCSLSAAVTEAVTEWLKKKEASSGNP